MADKTLNVRVKHRYDTEANWTSKNPVLLAGELAFSKDKNGRYKVGDGTSKWTDLPYAYDSDINNVANKASDFKYKYELSEGQGSSFYTKLFTLTVTQYSNYNYQFAITSRTDGVSYVNVYADSSNSTYIQNCTIQYTHNNSVSDIVINNVKGFLYKDANKNATRLEVWMKVDAWGDIRLFDKTIGDRSGTLTWNTDFKRETGFPTSSNSDTITIVNPTPYTISWNNVINKPSTFTPSSHSHTFNQISDRTTYIYDASTSRTKNTVLAAPNGSDGKATFRALTAADIPNLTKSKISDFPTSMPASDVSSWAKASTKPSYTKAEVGLGNVDNTADANKSVKYATSAGSAESCTGNAATATKLVTSRTVSGGTDITMSFNYDGSGNSLANIGYYNCNASNGNTNNYPYHRFAKLDVIADPYRDQTMTVYITQDYNGGGFGVARISLRTNNSSYVSEAEAKWLVRSGFSADALQVAIYEVYGKTYADAFIKLPGTYNGTVIRAIANGGRGSISRTWTLINSREVDSTTTSDAKTSTESYVNITTAGTEIHNQAYSKIITGVDAGTTSAANSVAWGGISGKPAIVGKTIKSRSNLGDANWTDLTTAQGLIPDMAFISYWNGAFSGASSNLAYCNKGAFGSIVTKNINDYATANHNHDSVYAKLSHNHAISDITNLQTTLNGKANSSHTHSYLPLSGGTLTGNLTVNGGITTSSDIIIPSICFSQDKDSIALGMTADNTIIVPNHKIAIGNLLKANGGISTEDISTTNIDITKLTFTRSTAASINFSNRKVSINSAGLNVDNGATFGAAISVSGSITANGSVRFIDYYSESTGDGNTRRAVSSSVTDGLKVGYLKSKTNSSTSKKQFCVMGQWGKEDDFGNATTKGSWTTGYILIDSTSDVRLKKNIKNTDISALPIINQMKVRQFDWKETGVHQQLGLVADELDKFDPLLTVGGGYEADGSMYVKQIDRLLLTEYAIKGIQEQQDEIVELQKENKELKQKISEIDTLKDELVKLKALIMNK